MEREGSFGKPASNRGPTSDPGQPQPREAEVESARLLANDAKDELRRHGLADDEIRRLADAFIAESIGQDLDAFIAWALDRHGRMR